MGTWGPGVFENDYALDLVSELARSESTEALVAVLRAGANGAVTSPEAQEAVAGAAIVLSAFGVDENTVPEAYPWISEHANFLGTQGLAYLALAALVRVGSAGSALRESWIREEVGDAYMAAVGRLRRGLEKVVAAGTLV